MNYRIDLIIPVYNEAKFIGNLLEQLDFEFFEQVMVIDGGSTDKTQEICSSFPILYKSAIKGRASQMNAGAYDSQADYLLFLHADVRLPDGFFKQLTECLQKEELKLASFRLAFYPKHPFLSLNAWFSRFQFQAFQFGDQGLLIQRTFFENLGGYDETLLYMEGNDIIRRGRKQVAYHKLPIILHLSSRKYEEFGVWRLQFSYYLIYGLTRMGLSQKRVKSWFRGLFH